MNNKFFSEREYRLLFKIERPTPSFEDKDVQRDTPGKLSVVRNEKAYNPETDEWEEQAGEVLNVDRDQLKQVMKLRLKEIWRKAKRAEIWKDVRDEWRIHAIDRQLAFPPKGKGEHRGRYMLRREKYRLQRDAAMNRFMNTNIERRMREIDQGGEGFNMAMQEHFGEDIDANSGFETAIDGVVDTVLKHPDFQRGVTSYKAIMEQAFSEFGRRLKEGNGGINVLLHGQKRVPDEFKNLWQRGPDGQYRLHVPGAYRDGEFVRDIRTDGYQQHTGETAREYKYQNEVDAMKNDQWRRVDEAFDLSVRTDTYEIPQYDDVTGEELDPKPGTFSEFMSYQMGLDIDDPKVMAKIKYLPLQEEVAGVEGGEIDPKTGKPKIDPTTGKKVNEYKPKIVGFRVPKYTGDKKLTPTETSVGDEAGREGIIIMEDGKVVDVRYFGEINAQFRSALESFKDSTGAPKKLYKLFMTGEEWKLVNDFSDPAKFDSIKYADSRIPEMMKKVTRISELRIIGETMLPVGGAVDPFVAIRAKIKGDGFNTLNPIDQDSIAKAMADHLIAHADSPSAEEEVRTYFVDVLELQSDLFDDDTKAPGGQSLWTQIVAKI